MSGKLHVALVLTSMQTCICTAAGLSPSTSQQSCTSQHLASARHQQMSPRGPLLTGSGVSAALYDLLNQQFPEKCEGWCTESNPELNIFKAGDRSVLLLFDS